MAKGRRSLPLGPAGTGPVLGDVSVLRGCRRPEKTGAGQVCSRDPAGRGAPRPGFCSHFPSSSKTSGFRAALPPQPWGRSHGREVTAPGPSSGAGSEPAAALTGGLGGQFSRSPAGLLISQYQQVDAGEYKTIYLASSASGSRWD